MNISIGSRKTGYFLLAVGAVLLLGALISLFVQPSISMILGIVGLSLVISGGVQAYIMQGFGDVLDRFPQRSMSEAVGDAANQMESMLSQMDARERLGRLRSFGRKGQATIVSTQDTGQVITGDPVYQYELQIDIPGQANYTTTHQQATPRLMVARVTPGAMFKVVVDQQNPHDLNLEWV